MVRSKLRGHATTGTARFQRLWPIAAALLSCLLLTACGSRPPEDVIYPHDVSANGARTVTIYVATTRERAKNPIDGFTLGRSDTLNYAAFTISIPPTHVAGKIEWPYSAVPHPQTSFIVVSHLILSRQAFDARVAEQARRNGKGEVSLFVHGYNISFAEGLFRMAQLSVDSDLPGVPVLFSWPSQARLIDYVTDKDSAEFSRAGLTRVIEQLTAEKDIRSIFLLGHSMGGWLTMEALGRMRMKGENAVLRKLDVVLAAPDIDEDVFTKQMETVGRLKPPLLVMVASDDRALLMSSILQGNRKREGMLDIHDPAVIVQARKEGVTLVDISSVPPGDFFHHGRYAKLASVYPLLLADQVTEDGRYQPGAMLVETTQKTLSVPFKLLSPAYDR